MRKSVGGQESHPLLIRRLRWSKVFLIPILAPKSGALTPDPTTPRPPSTLGSALPQHPSLTHILFSVVSNQLPQFEIPSDHCHLGGERQGGVGEAGWPRRWERGQEALASPWPPAPSAPVAPDLGPRHCLPSPSMPHGPTSLHPVQCLLAPPPASPSPRPGRRSVHCYSSRPFWPLDRGGSWHKSPEGEGEGKTAKVTMRGTSGAM